jgi:hypothetical protein
VIVGVDPALMQKCKSKKFLILYGLLSINMIEQRGSSNQKDHLKAGLALKNPPKKTHPKKPKKNHLKKPTKNVFFWFFLGFFKF